MDNEELLKHKVEEYRQAALVVFNSASGKTVLSALKSDYVDRSALCETPELTYFRLGQKELIQTLIGFLDDPSELDEKIVVQTQINSEV